MKFTLLIIDDEKNIREGLAANFEMDGYNVKLAENGKQGLEFLAKGDIDLVITDLRMPGISGEEVYQISPFYIKLQDFGEFKVNNPLFLSNEYESAK